MAYATAQELIDRVGEDALYGVADRDADGLIDTPTVERALDDASAEIDSYLAVRYPLPLATVPAALMRTCCDLALYHLSGNRTTEEVEKRYRNAIAWLRDLSAGRASLGAAPAETARIEGAASFDASPRVTGRERMKGGF